MANRIPCEKELKKCRDDDIELSDAQHDDILSDSKLPDASNYTSTSTQQDSSNALFGDDSEDGENEDEESILQRLTGNYRKFSETQRARNLLDALAEEDGVSHDYSHSHGTRASHDNGDGDLSVAHLHTGSMVDHSTDLDRNNDGYSDNNTHEGDAEAITEAFFGHEDSDDDENLVDGAEDDAVGIDNSSNGTGDSNVAALRMLANAFSAVSGSQNQSLPGFESFLGGSLHRSNSGNHDPANSPNSRSSESPFRRANNNNILLNSFFDQFMPSQSTSRIAKLIDGLESHDNAYLVMETLEEISSTLLMMTSIQSERQVPTHRLAAALVKVIGEYPDDLELQLVACRCIYNLAEVNFELMYELVSAGIIECLNSKLLDLSYIDMAEQALQALEIISRKAGRQCLLKGSVPIVLSYLDFFTIHAQRKALKIAANSSSFIPISKLDDIKSVYLTVKNVATSYTDSQCVESAWIFIANTVKNFQKFPAVLQDLIDPEFLKQLCSIFPLCFGDGKKSSGLVTFKTSIALLDSLSLLCSNSSTFSNILLSECDAGLMIVKILLSYENLDTTDAVASDGSTAVSIDALLKCPKELLISLLKLTCLLVPLDISSLKKKPNQSYIGNYYIFTDKSNESTDDERANMIQKNSKTLNEFYRTIIPVLLNIYDATVEYKVRRLVFVAILRIIHLMSPEQLEIIIHKSKITSTLASTITHAKLITSQKYKETELVNYYSLLFGSLLITQSLMNFNPDIFLNDFTKEGLISQMNDLSILFESEYRKIVDSEDYTLSNHTLSVHSHSHSDDYEDDDDEVNDSACSQSDEDDYDDEDLEYEDEDEDEDDCNNGDFSLHESANEILPINYKRVNIMDDGLKKLSKRSILDSLSALFNSIDTDYENLTTQNKFKKSENLMFLDSFIKNLKNSATTSSYDTLVEMWKKFAYSLDSFSNPNPVSSFELVSSGIVRELLHFFQLRSDSESLVRKSFQYVFCSSLSPYTNNKASPIVLLVKKLEEALDRNESFEIVGFDSDVTHSSRIRAASMTKQMKIKLVPFDSDNNSSTKGILLVVQAIATFETIQNFIKNSKSINLKSNFNLNSSSVDNEYHYDFYLNDQKIPSDATIFGAVYKSMEDDTTQFHILKNNLLKNVHVIKYKAQYGKLVTDDRITAVEDMSDALNTISDSHIIEVLKSLKLLYLINKTTPTPSTSDILFLNYKLSAKLNRQLDEPLIVASGILPDWAILLPREFPFLFPLESRLFFLKSTSFGYSRLIDYWSTKSKEEENSSRTPMLGRSIRHKLRISRDRIFSSAVKVMETYATNSGLIEIEFFDEVGSGLGPTLEFYSNVSKEFSKLKLFMWRSDKYCNLNNDVSLGEDFIHDTQGLFPRPLNISHPSYKNTLLYFKVLGKFLARSFLDSRLVDFCFNPLFFEMAMHYTVHGNLKFDCAEAIEYIRDIDEGLASSLKHLNSYLNEYEKSKAEKLNTYEDSSVKISDLMLTFVLPGYEEIKLIPNGNDIAVTASNLREYIDKVVDFTINEGIVEQIKSFVQGFSEIFPFSSLQLFSADELTRLTGKEVENWTTETLLTVIHADHGYSNDSPQIKWLINIMSSFDMEERRKFLKFITGSPRLPYDGFKGLSPQFTVVLKHCEDSLGPDDYLPSVMTCANYLKLPCYTTQDIMGTKIRQAMNEGNDAFLLS